MRIAYESKARQLLDFFRDKVSKGNPVFRTNDEFDDGGYFDEGGGFEDTLDARTYTDTAAGFLVHILNNRAGIPLETLDAPQIRVLEKTAPGAMGLHVPTGASTSCETVVGLIAETVGAVVAQDRRGRIYAIQIAGTKGGQWIREKDIVDIAIIDPPYGRAVYRHTMLYGQNWTVQKPADLALSLTETQRAAFGREAKIARDGDARVLARVRNARAPEPLEPLFLYERDALAECRRRRKLYTPDKRTVQITVKKGAWNIDLGRSVRVQHRLFGLERGQPMRVVGIEDELAGRRVRLTCWG